MNTEKPYTCWTRVLTTIAFLAAVLACSTTAPTLTPKPPRVPTETDVPTWTPTPTLTLTPTPFTGTISGTVVDAGNGSPIPQANVHTDPPTVSVTADSGGRYTISDVVPGIYTITAAKPGYGSASVAIAVTAGKTTTADVHLMATSAGVPSPTIESSLSDGLVVYYPFDESVDDQSGNRNHGTVHGATLTEDRFGAPNSAYAFDGLDDYIVSSSDIYLDTTYSVALWFRYNESSGSGTLFQRGYQGWCWYEPNMNINEDQILTVKVSGCDDDGAVGKPDIVPGEWYQVVLVAQDGSQALYLNGAKLGSTEHTYRQVFALKAFIGVSANRNTPVGAFFDGAIDDIRIYDRALSEAEVRTLYEQER